MDGGKPSWSRHIVFLSKTSLKGLRNSESERRRSSVSLSLCLSVPLSFLSCVGCVHQSDMPSVAMNAPAGLSATGAKEKDLPKRMPQASTCVAFGDFHLQA